MIPDTLAGLRVPIGSVRPYGRNPRRGDVAAIRQSLEANGQYRPIVVNRRTQEVLAGNHTLAAAQELGWAEIAATFVDVDEEQAARIALADNRTADLGGYDDGELAELLQSLPDLDGTGWDERELDLLLAQLERERGSLADTDPGPVPAEPRTAPGDLWLLGEHRLLCGDATDPAAVERLLDGGEPKLLVTDPPYGVELQLEWRDNVSKDGRAPHKALGGAYPAEPSYMRTPGHQATSMSGDTRADWSEAFALVPSLKVAYVWHASKHAIEVGLGLERVGFELSQMLIWDKGLFALARSHYHWQHEPCWYARRPGAGRFLGARNQSTVWSARSPKMIMGGSSEEKLDHPTQKPLELFLRPIRNHLRPGEAFYEPFCGSGTALIAGENVGRAGFAMEIDPRYCDVIVDRWERHTGQTAELQRERDAVAV